MCPRFLFIDKDELFDWGGELIMSSVFIVMFDPVRDFARTKFTRH